MYKYVKHEGCINFPYLPHFTDGITPPAQP
ncbi:hypothetical protein C4H55_06250, partial [Neisseria gonorrhoeae]